MNLAISSVADNLDQFKYASRVLKSEQKLLDSVSFHEHEALRQYYTFCSKSPSQQAKAKVLLYIYKFNFDNLATIFRQRDRQFS